MSDMTAVSKIINFSSSYKVRYISLSDPLFSQFERSFRNFFKTLGPGVETRMYARLAHYLKKIRYQLSISLLPYNQIVSSEQVTSIQDLIEQGKILNPEVSQIFDNILQALNSFNNHTSNSLLECLKQNILQYSSQNYCIVTKRDMYAPEQEHLLTFFQRYNITFMNEKKFREEKQFFDYVVFMGNAGYFHHSFNNSPKSRVSVFISRDTYRNEFMDNSLFIDWPFPVFSQMYQNLDKENIRVYARQQVDETEHPDVIEEPIEQETQLQEPDFSQSFIRLMAEIKGQQESEDVNERELVPAMALELQGEKLIFIRLSKGRHDVITESGIFARKRIGEIVPGDSLVLCSIDDVRLVERMADEMYKQQNIQLHRKHQATLKKYLSRMTEKVGIDVYCQILKKKGLLTITEAKIKNLLKQSSFKLQNKKEYFNFLLMITNNNEKIAMKYYESGRKLAAFHISAGKKARQILREALENVAMPELLAYGNQVIELEEIDGLSLEIRKIEGISTQKVCIFPSQDKKIINY